jgi:tetratricopeptide (TPR) repeat protein
MVRLGLYFAPMRGFQPLAAVLIVALLPSGALAQLGAGRVTGTIRDERGKPLKGATVTAANEAYFPRSFSAATDGKGRFHLLGLRRATYKMTIRADGFEPVTFDFPVRTVSQNPEVELQLTRALEPGPPPLLGNIDASKLQKDLEAAARLVASGKTDAAITAYRRIAQAAPALTSVNLQLGYLHELKRDRVAAIAAYEAALKGDPSNERARAALARLGR